MPLVSISNSQREPLSWANWARTVYHGMPADALALQESAGKYLAFLGRVSPEKGVDRAIEIAIRSGIPLKIAAKVDRADKEYFEAQIKPLLDHPLIDFIGEIGNSDKEEFLGNAIALLISDPVAGAVWLGHIEAMACGTPVIAYPLGSVPELIPHGRCGFLVEEHRRGSESGQADR